MAEPDQEPFDLVRHYMPDWSPQVMFDVGANVGQTSLVYAALFPQAVIHAFEPSPLAFRKLQTNLSGAANVVPHCHALGLADSRATFLQHKASSGNRLLPGKKAPGENEIEVEVRNGAGVFRDLGLTRIDYLKIDTEGHDYDVLLGLLPVLENVDFIQVEAAMNAYNRKHVPLRKFEDLLGHVGFYLFQILEPTMEWKRGGRPVLRRSNPVFINRRLVDMEGIR